MVSRLQLGDADASKAGKTLSLCSLVSSTMSLDSLTYSHSSVPLLAGNGLTDPMCLERE